MNNDIKDSLQQLKQALEVFLEVRGKYSDEEYNQVLNEDPVADYLHRRVGGMLAGVVSE